jgi:hypothetical protein
LRPGVTLKASAWRDCRDHADARSRIVAGGKSRSYSAATTRICQVLSRRRAVNVCFETKLPNCIPEASQVEGFKVQKALRLRIFRATLARRTPISIAPHFKVVPPSGSWKGCLTESSNLTVAGRSTGGVITSDGRAETCWSRLAKVCSFEYVTREMRTTRRTRKPSRGPFTILPNFSSHECTPLCPCQAPLQRKIPRRAAPLITSASTPRRAARQIADARRRRRIAISAELFTPAQFAHRAPGAWAIWPRIQSSRTDAWKTPRQSGHSYEISIPGTRGDHR